MIWSSLFQLGKEGIAFMGYSKDFSRYSSEDVAADSTVRPDNFDYPVDSVANVASKDSLMKEAAPYSGSNIDFIQVTLIVTFVIISIFVIIQLLN